MKEIIIKDSPRKSSYKKYPNQQHAAWQHFGNFGDFYKMVFLGVPDGK